MKYRCSFCTAQGIEAYGHPGKGEWAKPIFPHTKRVECENGHRWSVNKEKSDEKAEAAA